MARCAAVSDSLMGSWGSPLSLALKSISLHGLDTIPEVKEGDDIARLVYDACAREKVPLASGDVVIVTSKVVSKAEGRVLNLRDITPSRRARSISRVTGKDPVEVEIILRESKEIRAVIPVRKIAESFPQIFGSISKDSATAGRLLAQVPAFLVTLTPDGHMATDAGLDYSNNPFGTCTLMPRDPSRSAEAIRSELAALCGADVAVVITDTEVSFTHLFGTVDIAVGYSGIQPVTRMFGRKDRFGREKFGGADILVDELGAASALLMGQTSEGVPVVVVKNLAYEREGVPLQTPSEALSKGIWWSLLATFKLKLSRLLEPFV